MMTAQHAGRIPGPRGLPLIGVVPFLVRDPFGYCMDAAAQGEGLVQLDVGPMHAYIVSHPEYVTRILATNAGNYIKGSMMDGIRVALGNGLFTSDGDYWKRQRRLMQPAFHQRQIQRMAGVMHDVIAEGMLSWSAAIDQGQPLDILKETIHLNIRIVLRTLFGTHVDPQQAARMLDVTNRVFEGMRDRVWTFFLPPWLPTPGAARYRRAIAALDEQIYALIASRRAADAAQDDLLDLLLTLQDAETGERMSDRQIRDEIFTFFVAGYESTASGVSWTWYLLARHPEVAERLRAELDTVLGGRAPTYDDLPRLVYTGQVMSEAFRLYPAFPMYFRTSVAPDRLGPYTLPAGAPIIVSPYATHHDPRYWDNPEVFDPDRFTPQRFDAQVRAAYYPFGKGQRMCIGEPMALATARMLIATIAQAYDTQLVPRHIVRGHYAMTYQPKGGLPLLLRPRTVPAHSAQTSMSEASAAERAPVGVPVDGEGMVVESES